MNRGASVFNVACLKFTYVSYAMLFYFAFVTQQSVVGDWVSLKTKRSLAYLR